ncbi:PTS lactose/cellobiose transporter subunit IIA [Lactobacillus sp. ESL0791]|uniref:PTS lactose/cellobiose transporter subunit IIA n=1 Tax=Lactobacillus sp. ESL0791 TaxID=2983234 RepID=UPI0023F784D9|nr:PTS lactose/cellobiose transporter subunit IIA [Lactobacillus sp. ESL0791]MDF7639550.1 PTS lactose/cellobiose transporter subunit IIA [Lactobacillus sp. ESL0791]
MSDKSISDQAIKQTMDIILNAGDAREMISSALDEVADYNYEKAHQDMEEANKKLVVAHRLQTAKIQEEAEGKPVEYSVLFTHAQDTLMTINSEYNIVNHLIKVFEKRDKNK